MNRRLGETSSALEHRISSYFAWALTATQSSCHSHSTRSLSLCFSISFPFLYPLSLALPLSPPLTFDSHSWPNIWRTFWFVASRFGFTFAIHRQLRAHNCFGDLFHNVWLPHFWVGLLPAFPSPAPSPSTSPSLPLAVMLLHERFNRSCRRIDCCPAVRMSNNWKTGSRKGVRAEAGEMLCGIGYFCCCCPCRRRLFLLENTQSK